MVFEFDFPIAVSTIPGDLSREILYFLVFVK